MRSLSLTALVLLATTTTLGCGMLGPHGGAGAGAGGSNTAANYEPSQDVKDTVRKQEAMSDQTTDPALDNELAKQEKDVLHALALSLGKEPQAAGMPPYEPASQALAELRAAKFKLRIEPVTNQAGAAVANNFVQLKDSFTDRVQALQGKLAAGTATPAERAEIMSGSKQMMKLNGLKMQVSAISQAAMMTNSKVVTNGLTTMLQVSGMVAVRKQQMMDWTDADYARVKKILARNKHWEALAASTMGMLAAYEAIAGTNAGDPKALDAIADSTLKAFPLDPQVSDDDAKNYVSHLSENAQAQKAKYESMMRSTLGDQVYEQQYKQGIDAMFARAGAAADTKTVAQVAQDAQDKYKADLAKCARGEPISPGSLVGPAKCKEARAQAQGGGGGDDGSGGGGGAGGPNLIPGNVQNGINTAQKGLGVASALANGDTSGALQGAADMFPGDGPIQSSLQGLAALSKGDVKGALKSALGLASLIPGGSLIKDGLGAAGKLLGLFG